MEPTLPTTNISPSPLGENNAFLPPKLSHQRRNHLNRHPWLIIQSSLSAQLISYNYYHPHAVRYWQTARGAQMTKISAIFRNLRENSPRKHVSNTVKSPLYSLLHSLTHIHTTTHQQWRICTRDPVDSSGEAAKITRPFRKNGGHLSNDHVSSRNRKITALANKYTEKLFRIL